MQETCVQGNSGVLQAPYKNEERKGIQITIREPGSAITHFVAMMLAVFAAMPLLGKAGLSGNKMAVAAMMIFMGSMVLLYGASTLYHSVVVPERILKIFKKLDHMMIFVLIAGTYTPILFSALRPAAPGWAWTLFGAVWGMAAVAITFTAIDLKKYAVFSMICYIGMGWAVLPFAGRVAQIMTKDGFLFLLWGGISFTIGAVLYGIGSKKRWMHSVFHIFTVLGTVLQFFAIYCYGL